MTMAARTAIPPTTPPTMGPIGVESFFLPLFKLPPSLVSPKPGPELAMDVTSVAMLVADVKVMEGILLEVVLADMLVATAVNILSAMLFNNVAERLTYRLRALSCR